MYYLDRQIETNIMVIASKEEKQCSNREVARKVWVFIVTLPSICQRTVWFLSYAAGD